MFGKRKQQLNNHPINFFKKTELFTDLLEAIQFLNPSASDEQVF